MNNSQQIQQKYQKNINSICLFCGASSGNNPAYTNKAQEFGRLIAEKKVKLVYGGAQVGLMGVVATAVIKNGGKVVGVIPKFLSNIEIVHPKLSETIFVPTMHERKEVMFDLSDTIVVLPGGFGTLDEFFEVLTWKQLNLHKKNIFLMNISEFWTPLVTTIDHMINEGFVKSSNRSLIHVIQEPDEIFI